MNLRQKYKREKKRNEDLKKWFDSHVAKPNYVQIETADVQTLCVEELFSTIYATPPEDYVKDVVLHSLADDIEPFVKFEFSNDEYHPHLKVRATIRVLDDRKDY